MNKEGIACQNCNPCGILSGYGGAGTFSDGKLNFIPKLGKSDLTKYMPESKAYQLIDETEEIFAKFNINKTCNECAIEYYLFFVELDKTKYSEEKVVQYEYNPIKNIYCDK